MAFCTINGIDVEIAHASPKISFVVKGDSKRSSTGLADDSRRGVRETWSMRTPKLADVDGQSLQRLIWGMAHVANFNNGLQCASGLNPSTGYSGVTWNPAAGIAGVEGYVTFAGNASAPSLAYDAQLGAQYTVLWYESNDGTTWSGCGFSSAAGVGGYLNGAANAFVGAAATRLTWSVAAGEITFTNQDPAVVHVDHVVILPWAATVSQLETWTAANPTTQLWGPAPLLRIEGDMFSEDVVYAYGRVTTDKRKAHGATTNAHELAFELDLIDPSFVTGVFNSELPTIPTNTDEIGAFVFTGTLDVPFEFGRKADADSATPTLTAVAHPAGSNIYGMSMHYNATGDPVWVRTVDAGGAGCRWEDMHLDADNDAVYLAAIGNANMSVKDEAGAVLHSFTKPAGTFTFYAAVIKLQLSTGNVLWGVTSGWTADPGSTNAQCRSNGLIMSNGRLYLSGIVRFNAGQTALPTFNGANYPARANNASGDMGIYLVELDPSTGNGLNCVAIDHDTSPVNQPTYTAAGDMPGGHFLTADEVNGRVHIAANWAGDRNQGTAQVYVGRPHASAFQTRPFADWAGTEHKPFLATFDEDLTPIAASTMALTHASGVGVNQRSWPSKPICLPDGTIVWAIQLTNYVGASVTGLTIDRDGAGGSYGGAAMPEDRRGDTLIIATPMDHGSPSWVNHFNDNHASPVNDNVNTCHLQLNNDGTEILVTMRSQGNPNNHTTTVGGNIVTLDAHSSFEASINPTTGATNWIAKNRRNVTGAVARGVGKHHYLGGPADGKTYQVRMFRSDTVNTHGPENPDTTLGYPCHTKWGSAVLTRTGFYLVVRNADGTVDAANCFSLLRTTSNFTMRNMIDFQGY